MNYYEVVLGNNRHWKSSVFTYAHERALKAGEIVRVPFGVQKKHGVILRVVEKPPFATKAVEAVLPIQLSRPTREFAQWYQTYYGADAAQVYTQLLPRYLTVRMNTHTHDAFTSEALPTLTQAQRTALHAIQTNKKVSVLHGVTGSGKTRIYTHLIAKYIKQGKDALLLLPEISLTPQIAKELSKYARVLLFHSQLSDAERSRLWYQIAQISREPVIVIGARSCLFLPFNSLGIIVVDEAHEGAYKQENDVRYHAVHAAAGLCNAHGAKLIIGSATPPVAETYKIMKKGGALVCLHEKALGEKASKQITVIDMKDKTQFKQHGLLSETLLQEVSNMLDSKRQSLLFINRRGTAKLVSCSNELCEWQAVCPRCDLPMTYHHDTHSLLCHTCGSTENMIGACPLSGHATKLQSMGSKAIFADVQALFPHARIARFDSDNKDSDSFYTQYESVLSGEIDILIGTQQLIKGLDLPKLGFIGIVNADLSLHFPDYSSEERTFQLVSQAIGRVGRGHSGGKVVVQTRQPHSPIIRLALKDDWHTFYEKELLQREMHDFSPFYFYGKAIFRNKSEKNAIKAATKGKDSLQTVKSGSIIEGPIPCFHAKRNGYFYYQLIVRNRSRASLLTALDSLPDEALIDIDPSTLL